MLQIGNLHHRMQSLQGDNAMWGRQESRFGLTVPDCTEVAAGLRGATGYAGTAGFFGKRTAWRQQSPGQHRDVSLHCCSQPTYALRKRERGVVSRRCQRPSNP
jgi:hypothetical protein